MMRAFASARCWRGCESHPFLRKSGKESADVRAVCLPGYKSVTESKQMSEGFVGVRRDVFVQLRDAFGFGFDPLNPTQAGRIINRREMIERFYLVVYRIWLTSSSKIFHDCR